MHMIDITTFREAMSQLPAAVNIITTDGEAGRHGMTASAVCSVSDDPATVLVCVNRNSAMNAKLKANGRFCVNTLDLRHQALSMDFANSRRSIEDRFADHDWVTLATGAPALEDAAIILDCEVETITESGSHSVFFGLIRAVRTGGSSEPLIYFNRDFHTVAGKAA